ncbi:MAG TPA: NrfD/PsrC family molybdoenzyme membrane anchor subunit, partial [Acetobacteraceae bacterium]|nr:NrfD/PsrC family molybdoenzyme membrane anchor subunit [Acetobacteraceae bacterium]
GISPGRAPDRWQGQTYYGRPQLKPAPFNNALVGSYVFLAGLSGAAQLLTTLLDLTRGRLAASAVRRGRYLSLLAPTIGAACLVADLHTPKRFYNMLRLYKSTSPMSIGSWLLVAFAATATPTGIVQFLTDRVRLLRPLRGIARVTQVPASLTGAGLSTYTASLFSATSAPAWAAVPKSLAVRFGAASVASAAAAISLGEGHRRTGRDLDAIALTALAMELAATLASEETQRRAGIRTKAPTAGNVAMVVPLGFFLVSLLWPRHRSPTLSAMGSLATLGASLAMRIGVMREGDDKARRPDISMRFAQPDNLPH